jgi:hypothetical protein
MDRDPRSARAGAEVVRLAAGAAAILGAPITAAARRQRGGETDSD